MTWRFGSGYRAGRRHADTNFEMERTSGEIVGNLVLVAIIVLAIMQAMPFLGFDNLATLMGQFLVFAGQIVVGLVIFGLGLYLARVAAHAIRDTHVTQADLLGLLTRSAIIVLAGAMGLQQMGVGEGIILLAFGLLAGAIAVAAAVSFGIGGRQAAQDAVDRFYFGRLLAGQAEGHGSPTAGDGAGQRGAEQQQPVG